MKTTSVSIVMVNREKPIDAQIYGTIGDFLLVYDEQAKDMAVLNRRYIVSAYGLDEKDQERFTDPAPFP